MTELPGGAAYLMTKLPGGCHGLRPDPWCCICARHTGNPGSDMRKAI